MHIVHVLGITLAALFAVPAVLGTAYTWLAAMLVRAFFARSCAQPTSFPSVTLVKPLCGDEWNLEQNLVSFFEQDYPGPIQYLFGVHDPDDVALKTVDRLRERYPHAQVDVVVDSRLYGPNRKIANLVNMLEQAKYDVLCFADSDVTVERDYLRRVVGELQSPGVGLVTCVYRGLCAPGWWPGFAAAATNYHFLPGVVTGLALGRARPCFGQTIAMERAMLERIGGLAQFSHHLAEDHAIGSAVRRTGATVSIPPFAVRHACVETRFTKLFAHELRWSRTIRSIDPLGHLGSALMHPLPFAILALLMSGGATWAWCIAGVALAARVVLKWQSDRAVRQTHRHLWLLPMSDILSFGIFIASFFSTRVVWRGFSFNVDGDGLLSPVHDE
ncbi:bacteriohopanetetrol glucosamine biosynthesis glycosyltransferase HpnI [Paraburkholderia rhizosphaerae]|uniref:bacteriohopanetetrol glucosamine biosynthesis glycosyltransferase HpnI n=1 Tax=Paraburkholderia rhizosphaerae TaxID=480658 RepID=UPI00106545B5|nr:bacteriohopanetetrol glucosamine biosynthesis glycosyltransferase HpnI [Paraburkholderia rhizosphaerae]